MVPPPTGTKTMKLLALLFLLATAVSVSCTNDTTAPRPNAEKALHPCRTNGSCRASGY